MVAGSSPARLTKNSGFSIAIDAIDRTPTLQRHGAHAKERFRNLRIDCRNYAYEHGIDAAESMQWRWPLG